jgi:hypothetical protein
LPSWSILRKSNQGAAPVCPRTYPLRCQAADAGDDGMVRRVSAVAFQGKPGAIVRLLDKAVFDARERVRQELIASGLALPAR